MAFNMRQSICTNHTELSDIIGPSDSNGSAMNAAQSFLGPFFQSLKTETTKYTTLTSGLNLPLRVGLIAGAGLTYLNNIGGFHAIDTSCYEHCYYSLKCIYWLVE